MQERDEDGWIAFMIACYCGRKGVVQMLLNCPENNIELNARDLDGWTAFMIVCQRGHKAVVQMLLDHSDSNIEVCLVRLIEYNCFHTFFVFTIPVDAFSLLLYQLMLFRFNDKASWQWHFLPENRLLPFYYS